MFYREAEDCGVPGLILHKEFITEEEEMQLLEYLKLPEVNWEWHTGRRVVHYGVPFDYAVSLSRIAVAGLMAVHVDKEYFTLW